MGIHSIFCKSMSVLCATALVLTQYPYSVRAAPSQENLAAYDYMTKQLEPYNELLGYLGSKLNRSVYDPAALSASLGGEPNRLFTYVQESIAVRAYAGSLRGADGVLIDRSGNALDRSLLLAELLTHAGVESRILRGTLPQELAEQVAARSFEEAPLAPDAMDVTPEILAAIMQQLDLTSGEVESFVAQFFEDSQVVNEGILDLYRPAAQTLLTTLERDGAVDVDAFETPDLAALATEHYWVEYLSPGGDWIDLDTVLPDIQPGQSLVQAEEALAPDALPEELVHRLKVTVTLAIAQGDEIEDVTLIDETLQVPQHAGDEIMIANLPDALSNGSLNAGSSWVDLAGQINEYSTVLMSRDGVVGSPFFTIDGRIFNSPPGSNEGNAERTRESIGGATDSAASALGSIFAPLSDDADDTTNADKPGGKRVVGQSVEYTLITSLGRGQEPEETATAREFLTPWEITGWNPDSGATRQLAVRDDLEIHSQLSWGVRLAPMGYEVPANYLTYRQIAYLVGSQGSQDLLIRKMLDLPSTEEPPNSDAPLPWTLYSLAANAHYLRNDVAPQRDDVAFYVAAPSLLALEVGLKHDGDNPPILYEAIDLMSLGYRAMVPERSEDSARAAFERVVREGVLWTVLERTTIEDRARSVGIEDPNAHNLTGVFARAEQQGIGLEAVDPTRSPVERVHELPITPELQVVLSSTAEQGFTMVVPSDTVDGSEPDYAWWRVDPSNGETIGVAPGGRGQGMWEYLKTTYQHMANDKFFATSMHSVFSVFIGLVAFGLCIAAGINAGTCFWVGIVTALSASPLPGPVTVLAAILALILQGVATPPAPSGAAPQSGGSGASTAPADSSTTASPDSSSIAPPDSSTTASPDSGSSTPTDSSPSTPETSDSEGGAPPGDMTGEQIRELMDDLLRDMTLGPYRVQEE